MLQYFELSSSEIVLRGHQGHVVTLLEIVNLSQMFPAKLPIVFLAMVLAPEDTKLAWQVFIFQRACSPCNSLGVGWMLSQWPAGRLHPYHAS